MPQPPLQLDRLFFTEVRVKASTAASGTPSQGQVQTTVSLFENQANARAWQARVEIRVSPTEAQQVPYEIHLVAFGQFTISDERSDRSHAAQLVAVSGASIIYSAAREYLAVLTGRGPWGAFQLPTVSFMNVKVEGPAAVKARPSSKRSGQKTGVRRSPQRSRR